jgi:hypothetical protein
MTDLDAAPSAGRFEVRVTADSHFGWIRTRLSVERTMMSWLRTATALIGFGFAIVQFFDRLQQAPEARSAYLPNAPILSGSRAHRLRLPRARGFALAVPQGGPLPVGGFLCADRRHGEGADELAGCRGRRSPHLHRPVRLLRRAAAPRLTPIPSFRAQ